MLWDFSKYFFPWSGCRYKFVFVSTLRNDLHFFFLFRGWNLYGKVIMNFLLKAMIFAHWCCFLLFQLILVSCFSWHIYMWPSSWNVPFPNIRPGFESHYGRVVRKLTALCYRSEDGDPAYLKTLPRVDRSPGSKVGYLSMFMLARSYESLWSKIRTHWLCSTFWS